MITQRAVSGEPSWQQTMELESRKEVIERWLSDSIIPPQLVGILQEMLATTERQLQEVRSQAVDNTGSSTESEVTGAAKDNCVDSMQRRCQKGQS